MQPVRFGKYELLCRLAKGGMAEVHLASADNTRGDPLVCVKMMLPGLAEDREFLFMFIEEARLAAPLHHRNLVQVDELGLHDDRLFLAMEYIRGHALSKLVRLLEARREVLEPALAAAAIAQAARGLDYAHSFVSEGRPLGLVHRDVSPHNLILSFDGEVKVVDFGIAKATGISGTRTQHLKGKVPYMSPEQLQGRGIDRRSDVFGLGVTLYELCTGRRMFEGADAAIIQKILFGPYPDPRDFARVPNRLAEIIERACARKPEQRIATAGELASELEAFVASALRGSPEAKLAELARRVMPPLPTTRDEALDYQPSFVIPDFQIDLAAAREGQDEAPRRTRAGAVPISAALTAPLPRDAVEELPSQKTPVVEDPRPKRLGAMFGGVAVALAATALVFVLRGAKDVAPPAEVTASANLATEPPSAALPEPETAPSPPAPEVPVEPPRPEPVEPAQAVEEAAPVAARPAYLTLITNPWSEVRFEDGSSANTPIMRRALKAGRHRLVLRNPRLGERVLELELGPGEEKELKGPLRLSELPTP